MIRIEVLTLLVALLLAGCDREEDPAGEAPAAAVAPAEVGSTDQPRADASVSGDARPAKAAVDNLAGIVPDRQDITVDGELACALTVRYADGDAQPVTWRGEGCSQIHVNLASFDDLEKIGQDTKLGEESRDDLARMPGGRAVYIEGSYASALYPRNVMGRVYEVPLAD